MNQLISTLRQAAEILTRSARAFALVGGLAVSARTEPRFTRDIDLAVAVANDAEAEATVGTFTAGGYRVMMLVEQEATGRMATVRLSPSGMSEGSAVLDLLFASSGIEAEVAAEAGRIELVDGVHLPVARLGHLLALKVLARDDEHRPQDLADIRALIASATPGELTRAKEAVHTIEQRGFGRGRDLVAALEALLPAGG